MFGDLRGTEWVVLLVLLVVYFLPSYIAFARGHANKLPILLLNLLAGWTAVGWVAALIWALLLKPETEATSPATQEYRVGDVVNGYRFNGQQWVALDQRDSG